MNALTPAAVLARVAGAIPKKCRPNVVIIGSLAAGYNFFRDDAKRSVRTKDVDCVLEPHHLAVSAGQSVTRQLLKAGWKPAAGGAFAQPGDADTPTDKLPAVRLYPPAKKRGRKSAEADEWFIELLTVPPPGADAAQSWTRLPSFRFLTLTVHRPERAENLGIRYARPAMMALANWLEHPRIKPERMTGLFANRSIKRTNKDLGRVLALAVLAGDAVSDWRFAWEGALRHCFPAEWPVLAGKVGHGLRELLASPDDLDEAHHTCLNGLLATHHVSLVQLREAGERLIEKAVTPLKA